MNKIKISIAALLISGASYGQCISNYAEEYVLLTKERKLDITIQLDSMVVYLKQDVKSGVLARKEGRYYINQLKELSKILKRETILIENED